ncbi:MAG TPA: TusE/DsrC/DsvC family sulfur relay protein [Acidiferrobacterales bacterium]
MRAKAKQPPILPPLDEDGLLLDPRTWNESVARLLAAHHGVGPLGAEHWLVIDSLRAHYARFGAAPAMIQVCKLHGHDRHWVHRLFETCLNAWRVAGLPNPGEEAKAYLSNG